MGELVMSPTENKAVQRVQMSRLQCRKYVQRSMKMFRHSEMKVCLWRPERSIVWRRTTLEGAVVTEGITHHQGLCINAGQLACLLPRPCSSAPSLFFCPAPVLLQGGTVWHSVQVSASDRIKQREKRTMWKEQTSAQWVWNTVLGRCAVATASAYVPASQRFPSVLIVYFQS
jgi:hypothetical protein